MVQRECLRSCRSSTRATFRATLRASPRRTSSRVAICSRIPRRTSWPCFASCTRTSADTSRAAESLSDPYPLIVGISACPRGRRRAVPRSLAEVPPTLIEPRGPGRDQPVDARTRGADERPDLFFRFPGAASRCRRQMCSRHAGIPSYGVEPIDTPIVPREGPRMPGTDPPRFGPTAVVLWPADPADQATLFRDWEERLFLESGWLYSNAIDIGIGGACAHSGRLRVSRGYGRRPG